MSTIDVNILDEADAGFSLIIQLADPAQGEGLDLWSVICYNDDGYEDVIHFEAEESCESVDIVALAINAIKKSREN